MTTLIPVSPGWLAWLGMGLIIRACVPSLIKSINGGLTSGVGTKCTNENEKDGD